MTLFSCNGLTKSYYEKLLFENISFGLQEGERVGIIGRNGAGKTSLMRIVAGLDEPDGGDVAFNRDARFEYLPQIPTFNEHDTAMHSVVHAYNQDHGVLEDWELETRAIRLLGELGIHDVNSMVDAMSGGQRKRVAIARALMAEPDLLILDEPTNHLDAQSVQWLQDELTTTNTGLLLVTHDRYFLDAVCTRIVELDQHRLISYTGGYERYLERKEAMLAVEDSTAAHTRNKMRQELAWLAKGAKARRTKQKSRIDWIEQMQAQPEKTEIRDIEIELGHKFLGGKIIDAVDVSYAVPAAAKGRTNDEWLLHNFTYRAAPMDRIGIIGANGSGKSTLLNLLAGIKQPTSGHISIGETVTLGYFRQEIKDLAENETVLSNVRAVAEYIDAGVGRERYITAKELCDRFGYSSKQQHAYVHTLSGGERRRLGLLRVLMANPNVLFLDEPTNDFDIVTLSALEDYLQYFKGVLLVVSHDRFFLDRCVNTMWVYEGNGRIKEYPGNYSAYLEKTDGKGFVVDKKKSTTEPPVVSSVIVHSGQAPSQKKLSYKEQKEFGSLEAKIDELEQEKAKLEQLLNGELSDMKEITSASERLAVVITTLENSVERWLELGSRA